MKVAIVFEEKDAEAGGIVFNVYLEGLSETRLEYLKTLTHEQQDNEMSTAEFWSLKCFQIVAEVLKQTGALRRFEEKK